jgi:hypothetical protein
MDNLIINTNLPSIIVVTLHFLYNLFDDYWNSLNLLRSSNKPKHKSPPPERVASFDNDNASARLQTTVAAHRNGFETNGNGIELLNGMLSALVAQQPTGISTVTAAVQTDTDTVETPMNGVDKKLFSYFQLKYEFIEST